MGIKYPKSVVDNITHGGWCPYCSHLFSAHVDGVCGVMYVDADGVEWYCACGRMAVK